MEEAVLFSEGKKIGQVIRRLGVSDVTYYRWRKEYGGMEVEQGRRLNGLESENARLKKLVADLSLDNAILKEVSILIWRKGHIHIRPHSSLC